MFMWLNRLTWAQGASFLKFLDHTRLDTVGLLRTTDQLIAEAANYSTQNIHKTQKSIHSAGFHHAIPGIKWL